MTVHDTTCSCYHCLDGSPLGQGKAKGVNPYRKSGVPAVGNWVIYLADEFLYGTMVDISAGWQKCEAVKV